MDATKAVLEACWKQIPLVDAEMNAGVLSNAQFIDQKPRAAKRFPKSRPIARQSGPGTFQGLSKASN